MSSTPIHTTNLATTPLGQRKVAIPQLQGPGQGQNAMKDRCRVPRACTACRSRKIKCTGARPQCKHCATTIRECVYLMPRKDKLKITMSADGCSLEGTEIDIVREALRDQWQHLVLCPLLKMPRPESELETYVVIIDALDECDNEYDVRIIVQLLAKARLLTGVRLRVFLTSRSEVPIRHGFEQIEDAEHKDVLLHNISPSIVEHDIATFLEHHLRIIAKECYQHEDWPGAEVVRLLVRSASGLFIWAATACLFVREGLFPDERLRIIVEGSASGNAAAPEEQLNSINVTVLQTSVRPGYSAHEMTMYYSMLRFILGSIVVLASPLFIIFLGALLRVPRHKINQMLKDLHAILNIPENPAQPLHLHHPSSATFSSGKTDAATTSSGYRRGAHTRSWCLAALSSCLRPAAFDKTCAVF